MRSTPLSPTPPATLPMTRTRPLTDAERRAVTVFAVLVLAPVVAMLAPFWIAAPDPGLLTVLTPVAMLFPAGAALLAARLLGGPVPVRQLLAVTPVRPLRRLFAASALTLAGLALLAAVTLATAQAFGAATVRLGVLGEPGTLVTALTLPLAALAYTVLTTGEELGWRGFAQTVLAPLGFWRASLMISSFWALWHLPLTMTHFRLGTMTGAEVVATTGNLVLSGLVLSAVRALSRSVWPAAYGHAVLNTVLVFAYSQLATTDTVAFMLVGWAGWALAVLVVAVLLRRDRYADRRGS